MVYIVNTFDEVEAYLRSLSDLSEDARRRLVEAYLRDLAEHADDFLKRSPLEHESYLFRYDYVLKDGAFFFHFRFVADGPNLSFGIVQVIYVDHEKSPIRDS